MKLNMSKNKAMINGESHNGVQNIGRWPCGICDSETQYNLLTEMRAQKL